MDAAPLGSSGFRLRFDEEVLPVEGSFALAPEGEAGAMDEGLAGGIAIIPESGGGAELRLDFGRELGPGEAYALAGEAQDRRGNRSRFLLRFRGWNANPALLRLSEVETQKNSSTLRPHRDFVELEVLKAGNLGGIELSWASSLRVAAYSFPAAEVGAGEFIVLHLAPEGGAGELDERGSELGLSGGVDASASGRDFWSAAGPLPDENGLVILRDAPGGEPRDALFYADSERRGELGTDKLGTLVTALMEGGAWPRAGSGAQWEDAFRWNPGSSRSLCRGEGPAGPEAWRLSAASAQSPGLPNPP
jgi:hypothetical protein